MNVSSTSHRSRLGWNALGWFGSSLGAIAWLAVAGAMSIKLNAAAGALLLGLFAVPLCLSLVLWQRRHSMPILRALTMMLTVDFLAVAAGIYVLYHYQVRGFLSVKQFPTQAFIILPILYVFLLWRFRSLSKNAA